MKINKIILIALLLAGCAKNEAEIKSLNLVLKSNEIKFKGQAFLRQNKTSLILDLYSIGQWVNSIKINDKICINKKCYKKSVFNQHFFGEIYYNDLLKDILLCKPIFTKKNYQATNNGFEQNIKDIKYEKYSTNCKFISNSLKIIVKN